MSDKYIIESDVAFEKNQDALGGYTSASLFRGLLTLGDVAILSGCTTVLVKGVHDVALSIGSSDVLSGMISAAAVGAGAFIAPKAIKHIGKQVSDIKEYRRMYKLLNEQQDEYIVAKINNLNDKKLIKK